MSAFEILKHVAASCLGVLIAISFKGLLDCQVSVHRVGGESDVGEVAIGMCG